MGRMIDIEVGQRFGKLTILKEVDIKYGKRHFICKCDCGEISNPVPLYNLTTGKTVSCGCVMRSSGRKNFKKFNIYKKINKSTGQCYSPDGLNMLFIFSWRNKEAVENYCWYTREDGYALANDLTGRNKKIRFHRLVLSVETGIPIHLLDNVDHINGDTRDNRIENLRNITGTENTRSKIKYSKNVQGYMGVRNFRNRFQSTITCNGKSYSKVFDTKKEALIHRLKLEYILFGEEFSPQRHLFKKYGINGETTSDIKI